MHFPKAINSDLSVLIVCNKAGGTRKGGIKKIVRFHLHIWMSFRFYWLETKP